MNYLTKEQQKVLGTILLLLLTGLAVRTWRKAHPPQAAGLARSGVYTNHPAEPAATVKAAIPQKP